MNGDIKNTQLQESARHLKRYANENKLRNSMIKTSTIINLRRRNLEEIIEKQLNQVELQQQEDLKKNDEKSSAMLALRTMTLGIILRVAGTMFQSLLSLSACVAYVISTYYEVNGEIPIIFAVLEVTFASLFSIDYIISFYNAKNKKKFVVAGQNIMDLLTILPVFASYVPGGNSSTGSLLKRFIGVVRVLRVFRVLRMYRLFGSQNTQDENIESAKGEGQEVRKKLFIIVATVLAIVFISTGIILSFQNLDIGFVMVMPVEGELLTFDSAFYFMIVTVCTVGYGDLHAGSDLARVVIAIFIIIIIVMVSKQTSELNELLKFQSLYTKPYNGREGSQVILIGNISSNTLNKFLREFYHPDHNMTQDMKVVIIQDCEPSKDIFNVLSNSKYEDQLLYIKGNVLSHNTLQMAKIYANKIFILSDQYSPDSNKDDTNALLYSKSIHEYDHNCEIYVQLVDPEFLLHSWADWDVVMSTQAYKMGIIASNVFNPGFATFIGNLCTTTSTHHNIPSKFPNYMVEYCNGLAQEFYLVSFTKDLQNRFIGKPFILVVEIIFMQHGYLMVGIKTHGNQNDMHAILMNPINYIIKQNDEAIIICPEQNEIENIFWDETLRTEVMQYCEKSAAGQQLTFTPKQMVEMNISRRITESTITNRDDYKGIDKNDHFYMWETDLRQQIQSHIIVVGDVNHLAPLLTSLRHYTKQYICFMCDKPPDDRWTKIRHNFSHIVYLEVSFTSIDEIRRTAIEDAFHVILLSLFSHDAAIQDSGILPIVRIIEEHFPMVPYTLELVEESNLRYLNFHPQKSLDNISYNLWPRHASSDAFFSQTMDFLMAQTYHKGSVIDIVGKLINSNIFPNIQGQLENNKISVIKLTGLDNGNFRYIDLLKALIDQERHIIPLALIKQAKQNENELPVVIINPNPMAIIQENDMILIMGNVDVERILSRTASVSNQMSKEVSIEGPNYYNSNDEIIQITQRILLEDDVLSSEDPVVLEQILKKLPESDRQQLIKQNEDLRQLLNDYFEIKNRIFV